MEHFSKVLSTSYELSQKLAGTFWHLTGTPWLLLLNIIQTFPEPASCIPATFLQSSDLIPRTFTLNSPRNPKFLTIKIS